MTDQKETPTEYVATVSVKLPDFWTEDPDFWFLHAEAAFRNAQITQSKLALLPEDEKPGCLFQGLFLERLPVKMRDHLVSREFKHPSEMALYADGLWGARKAIPTAY